MSNTRIYTVIDGENQRLVRAASPAQAVRHVANNQFDVRVSTQTDLENLINAGVKVETAGATNDTEKEPSDD